MHGQRNTEIMANEEQCEDISYHKVSNVSSIVASASTVVQLPLIIHLLIFYQLNITHRTCKKACVDEQKGKREVTELMN